MTLVSVHPADGTIVREHAAAGPQDVTRALAAAVFTADRERGTRIAAERSDAGCCFVNVA